MAKFRLRPWWILLLIGGLAHAATIAYEYPVQSGNQTSFNGALGMDFDVNGTITVVSLGVFDSDADGLQRPLTVYLYDRTTEVPLATLVFGLGSTGTLLDGARFLPLATGLVLNAGFQGSIVVDNYGVGEPNGNDFGIPALFATNLNTGGGLITFSGSARFGPAGTFPTTIDSGPADRYGAGTFQFEAGSSVPEPATSVLAVLALSAIFLGRRMISALRA